MQYAIADYLQDSTAYERVSSFYEEKRNLTLKLLKKSSLKPLHTCGTYFQLVDYSHTNFENGIEITNYLVKEKSLSLIPLEPFYQKYEAPKLIRICFAKKDKTLKKGLKSLNAF